VEKSDNNRHETGRRISVDYDNCYTSIALDVENSFKFPDSKIKIL
jgi:hypothetical protein